MKNRTGQTRLRTNVRFGQTPLRLRKAHMAMVSNPNEKTQSSMAPGNGQSYRGPFAIMTILFFMWGFMTVWNDVLIPRFKEAFTLNYFQAMLVQFAFFGAYAIGGIL